MFLPMPLLPGNSFGPQAMIDKAAGTIIGTYSSRQSAAFDGTLIQASSSSAFKPDSITTYIGKDWGSGTAKRITGFKAHGTSEMGFIYQGGVIKYYDITVSLYGSNTDPTTTGWTGTLLGSADAVANSAGLIISKLTGISTDSYRYSWLKIVTDSGVMNCFIAECEFYEGGY